MIYYIGFRILLDTVNEYLIIYSQKFTFIPLEYLSNILYLVNIIKYDLPHNWSIQ